METNNDSFTGQILDENAIENKPLPKLYSDRAIMGFAVFFSTFFASFLVIENLKETGARKGIVSVVIFSILFTIIEVVIVGFLPAKANSLSLPFNLLGGAILNFYFWKKYIPADLVYEKKKIWKPLIVGFVLVAIFFVLILMTGQLPK